MKKLFCVFLALSIALFVLPFFASAQSGITVKMENSYLQAGERVSLSVTFDAGRDVQAFMYTVEFDPDELIFISASDGTYNNYESGKVRYVDVGNGTKDTETFVFLTKKEGTASIGITDAFASDQEEYNYSSVIYNFTVDKATRGDVNGNGAIDTSDLASLKLHLAGVLSEVSEFADYNMDLVVNTVDLASLKQYLAEG